MNVPLENVQYAPNFFDHGLSTLIIMAKLSRNNINRMNIVRDTMTFSNWIESIFCEFDLNSLAGGL